MRAAVAVGRSVFRRRWWIVTAAVLVLLLLESAFVASALTGEGCGVCHAPAQAEARLAPGHGSVACLDCHREAGAAGWARLNVRAAENLGGWLLRLDGVVAVAATGDDARCRACHAEGLGRVVSSGDVRMRHSDVEDTPCVRCHESHPSGLSAVGVTDPHRSCRACHDGVEARSECGVCHSVPPDSGGAPPEPGKAAHPVGWRSDHGMGALTACADCHAPEVCVECHGVPLPHDRATFLYTHGDQTLAAGEATCLSCHAREACDECHTVPVPHPGGFLEAHSSLAEELGGAVCGTCHLRTGCDRCHLEHIHPGLPEDQLGRLRDSTGID